jgi:hypothetical protein
VNINKESFTEKLMVPLMKMDYDESDTALNYSQKPHSE